MTLLRLTDDGVVPVPNIWKRVTEDEALPEGEPVVVPLGRWVAERDTLAGRNAPTGVWLRSDEVIDAILADLDTIPLIGLDFPNMNDGRHFTTARLLRERYGYRGEIRATGQVLRDQLFFMERCGFDSFELAAGKDADSALRAFQEFSVVYQSATDARTAIPVLRHQQRQARAAE